VHPFEARVVPSLLDRLTDHQPSVSSENPLSRTQVLRAVKQSLWRDLSNLLNTKRADEEVPPDFAECNDSLLTYGLPDFTSYSMKSPYDQAKLQRVVENTIRRFERRLERVKVIVEPPDDTNSALHFRVDAFLIVKPAPEPISFETLLQPDSYQFVVVGDER
jgi:type VI secretion system protein ImpF